MQVVVEVEKLVRHYGSLAAVDGVSFSVKAGEIFGILGPNGAGKTTTLEVIEGLRKPTEGRVSVFGLDVEKHAAKIKARIGVQLQASSYYDYLGLAEILALLGSFYPKRRAPKTLLEQVGLADKASRRVRQLSGGERQRFAVAASLVNDPELVILDEPTTGLDPQARRDLWSLVGEVRERGATVLLTTHYMEEAEAMCDRLAIMGGGRILAVDSPRNLVRQIEGSYAVRLATAAPLGREVLAGLDGRVELVQADENNAYLLRTKNDPQALQAILAEITNSGAVLERLEITPVTLEDVFLKLTGRQSDGQGAEGGPC